MKIKFSALISSYLSRYSSIPILPLPKEYFAKYTTMPYISDRNIPRILTFPGVNIPITANTFLHKSSFLSASETDWAIAVDSGLQWNLNVSDRISTKNFEICHLCLDYIWNASFTFHLDLYEYRHQLLFHSCLD